MNSVVHPGHGADGAQCREGGHRDLGDGGEPLCRELPAAANQPSVWVIRADRDGEERVQTVCSTVLVDPQERQLRQPRYRGRLCREADEERVETPSLPYVGREGGPIEASHSKPGRQSPDEAVRESAGLEDLSHRPRRPTAPGVGHGDRRLARSAAAAAGGGTGVDEASAWVLPGFRELAVKAKS